jgi:hypothetical protein
MTEVAYGAPLKRKPAASAQEIKDKNTERGKVNRKRKKEALEQLANKCSSLAGEVKGTNAKLKQTTDEHISCLEENKNQARKIDDLTSQVWPAC